MTLSINTSNRTEASVSDVSNIAPNLQQSAIDSPVEWPSDELPPQSRHATRDMYQWYQTDVTRVSSSDPVVFARIGDIPIFHDERFPYLHPEVIEQLEVFVSCVTPKAELTKAEVQICSFSSGLSKSLSPALSMIQSYGTARLAIVTYSDYDLSRESQQKSIPPVQCCVPLLNQWSCITSWPGCHLSLFDKTLKDCRIVKMALAMAIPLEADTSFDLTFRWKHTYWSERKLRSFSPKKAIEIPGRRICSSTIRFGIASMYLAWDRLKKPVDFMSSSDILFHVTIDPPKKFDYKRFVRTSTPFTRDRYFYCHPSDGNQLNENVIQMCRYSQNEATRSVECQNGMSLTWRSTQPHPADPAGQLYTARPVFNWHGNVYDSTVWFPLRPIQDSISYAITAILSWGIFSVFLPWYIGNPLVTIMTSTLGWNYVFENWYRLYMLWRDRLRYLRDRRLGEASVWHAAELCTWFFTSILGTLNGTYDGDKVIDWYSWYFIVFLCVVILYWRDGTKHLINWFVMMRHTEMYDRTRMRNMYRGPPIRGEDWLADLKQKLY